MKTMLPNLRPLALAGAVLLLLAAAPGRARAAFTFTLSQAGPNVVVTGTGTINTAALTLANTARGPIEIVPNAALLAAGATAAGQGLGVAGPSSFGSGGATTATGSGNIVVIVGAGNQLFVPIGYVSGSPLADMATFPGATFNSLGFTPGTYTYTWGTGANADSLTVTGAVPEPSTWAFVAAGAGLLGLTLRRASRA